ncbi:MAG TPA: hypothetical protein VF316_11130 [Polyangiaceae bacterium]
MKLALALALPLALVTFSGCSKPPSAEEQKKNEEQFAAALTSALVAPPSASAATAAAPPSGAIGATCNNKTDGKCTESLGAEGLGAADSCKTLGGVYAKGATPCSRDNLLGTCARADTSSGLNDVDYYYAQAGTTADSMKSLCEGVMSGTWTTAPKGPAAKGPAKAKK